MVTSDPFRGDHGLSSIDFASTGSGTGHDARRKSAAGPMVRSDAVGDLFGHQPGFTGFVEGDLLSDLIGADQVLPLEGQRSQASALQAGSVHQLVGD